MTHGRLKDSDLMEAYGVNKLDPVGKVIYHDLNRDGKITYYDVDFGGNVVMGIPAEDLISENSHMHEHAARK